MGEKHGRKKEKEKKTQADSGGSREAKSGPGCERDVS